MENNSITSSKDVNVLVNTELLDASRCTAVKTEFEEFTNNEVSSIKCEIENFDEQLSQGNLNRIDPPLCVINAVSSLALLEVDSNLDNDQKNSAIPSSEKHSLKESANALVAQNHKSKTSSKNIVSWEFAKSFDSFQAANRYIDDGEYWAFVQQSLGDEGLKNYYRCNLGADPDTQCPAQMYLLFHAATGNVLMCRSFDKHTQHIEIQKTELTKRVKDIINRFLELRLTPEAIMKNLAQINDIIMPKYSQVEEYIRSCLPFEHEAVSNQNNDKKNTIGYQNRNKNLLVDMKPNGIQKEIEVDPEKKSLKNKKMNKNSIQSNTPVSLEDKKKAKNELNIENNCQDCTEYKKVLVGSMDKKKSHKGKIKRNKKETKSVMEPVYSETMQTVPSDLLLENAKHVCTNDKQEVLLEEKRKPKRKRELLYLSVDMSIPPEKQPKRGQRRNWILFKEFDSEAAAISYIDKEKCWGFNQQQFRVHGVKKYYRCNQVRQKGPRCPASCYIFIHKPSNKVLLYYTPYEHDHDQNVNKIVSKKPDLNISIEEEIKKLHALGLRPQSIMDHLAKLDNVELPTDSELRSYLNYLDNQHVSNEIANDNSINTEELPQVQLDKINVEKGNSKHLKENIISATTAVI